MKLLGVVSLPLRRRRLLKFGPNVVQTATLTGRTTRGGPLTLPKPFPYQDKAFMVYHDYLDNTMLKVSQENARVVVVEGPIGVGKSAFCKLLAEEFDMYYMPQPTMDSFYVLPSGYDLRQHDHELPEEIRSYDHKNFCTDPKSPKASRFQVYMLYLKFFHYMDAICHILNTGQGVVLERSYYSDYVFMRAMLEQKYISKEVAKAYLTIKENTSTFFMAPHLIIYLDIPVPVVQERIRTRNYSYEQNSPALTKEYLESLEKYWKQDYLKQARSKSDILIYDWTDGGDIDVVIDDIEKLDLHTLRRDLKFTEWWMTRNQLFKKRYEFTNESHSFLKYFVYPYYRVDELYVPMSVGMEYDKILNSLPECQYDIGYNPLMGDSIMSILFNTKTYKHRHPKHHLLYCNFKF